jgi:hypothetical protein
MSAHQFLLYHIFSAQTRSLKKASQGPNIKSVTTTLLERKPKTHGACQRAERNDPILN